MNFYGCLLLASFFQSSSCLPLHMNIRYVPHVTQLHTFHSKKTSWYVMVLLCYLMAGAIFLCNWMQPVTWPKYRPFLQCDWTCSVPVTLNTSILSMELMNSYLCDGWEIWASGAFIRDSETILLQELGRLFSTIPQHCVPLLQEAKIIRFYMVE